MDQPQPLEFRHTLFLAGCVIGGYDVVVAVISCGALQAWRRRLTGVSTGLACALFPCWILGCSATAHAVARPSPSVWRPRLSRWLWKSMRPGIFDPEELTAPKVGNSATRHHLSLPTSIWILPNPRDVHQAVRSWIKFRDRESMLPETIPCLCRRPQLHLATATSALQTSVLRG